MVDVLDKERQGLDPTLKDIVEEVDRNFVYCRTCSTVIARDSDRIEAGGSHDHQFTNPFGVHFHIGCFSQALGCSISGERSAAETWFPGFQWQHASCSECRSPLGWYFDCANEYFYGLILDRIQND
jgi:hypothetical protein